MGEHSWARLTIGGAVSRQALADALETLAGCRLDECLEDDQVVVEDPEAPWGGFAELEAWLEIRNIPFDLESAARSGCWPDLLIHCRPGWGRVELACDDGHREPVIPRSAIRAALARCRSLRRAPVAGPNVPRDPAAPPDHLDARPGRRELTD